MTLLHRTAPDAALLRRAASEPAAFAELYLRHEAVVAGYLQRRTRNAEVTADLTAETFATALLRADRFSGDGPAIAWLLGIARNLHLHWLRRGRAEARARERLGVELVVLSPASAERVEALTEVDDPRSPLRIALAGLPEAQRAAVLAYILDDRSYDDLATELGVPAATVRQRVSRGLTRLRTSIEGARP
ncbi:MAG: RNA polymerase sigma factor [Solirubrobacteraceae bacterium]|nr:RNA polymerase sigma factor [Solirubrobacteraceae bacterium]